MRGGSDRLPEYSVIIGMQPLGVNVGKVDIWNVGDAAAKNPIYRWDPSVRSSSTSAFTAFPPNPMFGLRVALCIPARNRSRIDRCVVSKSSGLEELASTVDAAGRQRLRFSPNWEFRSLGGRDWPFVLGSRRSLGLHRRPEISYQHRRSIHSSNRLSSAVIGSRIMFGVAHVEVYA